MGSGYCCEQQDKSVCQEISVENGNKTKAVKTGSQQNGYGKEPTVKVTAFQAESVQLEMESLQKLFYEIKGKEPDGKSKLGDSYLYIDGRNDWTLKLLNMLAGEVNLERRILYILPEEIKGVGIGYLDERGEPVKRFLSKGIKHDLEWLWVNYIALDKWEKQYRLGISEYMAVIEAAAPFVTKWIGLNYFKIDSLQMEKIFKACYNVEKVDFDNCSFKLENPMDFGEDSYKIEKISMEDTFIKTISLKQ